MDFSLFCNYCSELQNQKWGKTEGRKRESKYYCNIVNIVII